MIAIVCASKSIGVAQNKNLRKPRSTLNSSSMDSKSFLLSSSSFLTSANTSADCVCMVFRNSFSKVIVALFIALLISVATRLFRLRVFACKLFISFTAFCTLSRTLCMFQWFYFYNFLMSDAFNYSAVAEKAIRVIANIALIIRAIF